MTNKTEELSMVIDKILESRLTGKIVQRQQILRACKKEGLMFTDESWGMVEGGNWWKRTVITEPIEVE